LRVKWTISSPRETAPPPVPERNRTNNNNKKQITACSKYLQSNEHHFPTITHTTHRDTQRTQETLGNGGGSVDVQISSNHQPAGAICQSNPASARANSVLTVEPGEN
uniref:Uncharacterized protein n=1 Tax=Anopheles quadriannulatus TaxID=34691 RepID=A0A182XR41_ANOQN